MMTGAGQIPQDASPGARFAALLAAFDIDVRQLSSIRVKAGCRGYAIPREGEVLARPPAEPPIQLPAPVWLAILTVPFAAIGVVSLLHAKPDPDIGVRILEDAGTMAFMLAMPVAAACQHLLSVVDAMNGRLSLIARADADGVLWVDATPMPETETYRDVRVHEDRTSLRIASRAAERLRGRIDSERIYRVYFSRVRRRVMALEECDDAGRLLVFPLRME